MEINGHFAKDNFIRPLGCFKLSEPGEALSAPHLVLCQRETLHCADIYFLS